MKVLFVSAIAAACSMFMSAGVASAQHADEMVIPVTILPVTPAPVEIPAEVSDSKSVGQTIRDMRAVQAAEIAALLAQNAYYNMMLASFEGSYAMSKAFEAETSGWNTTGQVTKGTVTVVADYALLKYWLRGALPTAAVIKDLWAASRGDVSVMTSAAQKTWGSIMTVFNKLKMPKSFITTATLGTFAYVQYENFWVINMSDSQYHQVVEGIKANIAHNDMRRAAIADTFVPAAAK